MANAVIELVDLTKTYGSFTAVDRLNLSIGKGEVFGLLGPNGAGKSTTILMMLGLTEPTAGKVTVCGIDSTHNPIDVKRVVGYLPEDVGFYDDRNALENLMYTARLNRIPDHEAKQRAELLLERVGLADNGKKKTGKYSRGMRQRLGLADVLIKDPEVIILDEPTSGIDPQGVREFLELIDLLRKEKGLTVLFSSHNLHQVQQVCDRVGIFVSGKLMAEGNVEAFSQKLFTNSLYVIEAGLDVSPAITIEKLPHIKELLMDLDGVKDVRIKKGMFEIECTHDISTHVARTLVRNHQPLSYLNKKAFGLDDIYNRYFEGGNHHG